MRWLIFFIRISVTSVLDGILRLFLLIDDGIANVICISDEHLSKALSLILVTDDWIVICVSDERLSKALSPISVIDDGIVICSNDLQ